MRALNKGWIGIVLVILFGASLFFFRGSARYSNLFNSDNFVANISGTPISTTQFLRSLELNIGQFAQMIGEELSGDQIRAFQIHQLVLQNLVNNAIFENEFDNLNYILDDSIVAKKTKERFPNLYINNKINDDALNSFLRLQRLKIEDLVNIIEYETRAAIFDDLIFEKKYPSELNNKINLFNSQTRKIELLKVPYENISVPNLVDVNININDPEVINYFEENSKNYLSNEKRDISYIIIDKNNYKNEFVPNENEIENYFNNNKELFAIPEKRSFKQFNFKSKKEAEDFKLNVSGMSGDEIITYSSNNDIKYNNFEDVDNNQVLEELSNVIFSLNVNDISEIVSTTLAYHIIFLDKIITKSEPKINDVSDNIKDTLTKVKLDNFFNDLKSKINQQIFDGLSMNDLSIENKLVIENINEAEQNEEGENEIISNIIRTAFAQNKEFITDIIDFDSNISFVINVNEIYPSKVQSIDGIFSDVKSDFIKSKRFSYANEIFTASNKDRSLNEIKQLFNSNIETLDIKLNSDDLPKALIDNLFNTDLNKLTFSSDDDYLYYAKIKNITIPNEGEFLKDINLITELKNAFGNEVIKTKNITFNDELIEGLLSQYK